MPCTRCVRLSIILPFLWSGTFSPQTVGRMSPWPPRCLQQPLRRYHRSSHILFTFLHVIVIIIITTSSLNPLQSCVFMAVFLSNVTFRFYFAVAVSSVREGPMLHGDVLERTTSSSSGSRILLSHQERSAHTLQLHTLLSNSRSIAFEWTSFTQRMQYCSTDITSPDKGHSPPTEQLPRPLRSLGSPLIRDTVDLEPNWFPRVGVPVDLELRE